LRILAPRPLTFHYIKPEEMHAVHHCLSECPDRLSTEPL
jgi:hypothetical protein